MKFPKEFCRCGWHKAAFSLEASCVEVFFSILPEIRKAEILFFYPFNECSLMEEVLFTKGVIRDIRVEANRWVNVSMILFHQKKNAGTKERVNTEVAHSSQPDVNVYCVGCSEGTVTGTKKILVAEMQNHPHCDGHTPPTPDEQTCIKKGWKILLHKRRNDVLQLQGLGIKGFCSLPRIVTTVLLLKLASQID